MAAAARSTGPARTDSMSVAKASAYLLTSTRRFRLLVDQGVFTKAWGTGYDADTILREYLDHLHRVIADRKSGKLSAVVLDPIAERARRDREIADRMSLQNSVTRGEQAPTVMFGTALRDAVNELRARAVRIPDDLADQLVAQNRATISECLRQTLHHLLQDLAHPQPKTD